MTIGLTYNPDLSRVQIALSDMPDGTVQVQRVANAAATEALWARGVVRGGVALPIEGGAGNVDDFEFFADIANHYRTVPVDPPAGLLLTGVAGDFASTPEDPALDLTGDIDVRVDLTLASWIPGEDDYLVTKFDLGSGNASYALRLDAAGTISLVWSTDGSSFTVRTSTALPTIPASGRLTLRAWLNVDNGATGHNVTFYTGPSVDGPWTQLGNVVVTAGITSVFSGAADLIVGARGAGALALWPGTVHAMQLRSSFDGTIIANPDFAAQPAGTTSFTDAAGRLWSVNGDARIVGVEGPEQITPSLDGQVWLKSVKYPALNRSVRLLDRGESIDRPSRSEVRPVVGQSPGNASHDQRLGRRFTLHLMTEGPDHLAEAGDWDIIFTASTTWFVHVPAASQVPGGYVALGETSQRPLYRGSAESPIIFELPCTIERPPAPQVTDTFLVAETIFRLFGDANALYAAHTTGRSLLATIADPSDVVVI